MIENKSKRKFLAFTCQSCGKIVETPAPWEAKDRKYCSKECAYKMINKIRMDRINITCKNCNKEFQVPKHRSLTSKYCSRVCMRHPKCTNIFKNFTPGSLWALGWFITDGCLVRSKSKSNPEGAKVVVFSGQKEAMEKLMNIIGSEHKLQRTSTHIFRFSDNEIWDTLFDLGMMQRKSSVVNYPKIPVDYESTRHFIRGAFEGDGTASLLRRRENHQTVIHFSIASTSSKFRKGLFKVLNSFGIVAKENNHGIRFSSKFSNVKAFYKFLYENVSEYLLLSTKKKIFEQYFEQRQKEMKKQCKCCNKEFNILTIKKEFCNRICRDRYLVALRKNSGLCITCSLPVFKNKNYCKKHRDLNRINDARRKISMRKKHKEMNLCYKCNKPVSEGKKHCKDHLDQNNINSKERRNLLKKMKLCIRCKKPTYGGHTLCEKHLEEKRHNNIRSNDDLRFIIW